MYHIKQEYQGQKAVTISIKSQFNKSVIIWLFLDFITHQQTKITEKVLKFFQLHVSCWFNLADTRFLAAVKLWCFLGVKQRLSYPAKASLPSFRILLHLFTQCSSVCEIKAWTDQDAKVRFLELIITGMLNTFKTDCAACLNELLPHWQQKQEWLKVYTGWYLVMPGRY